MSSAVDVDPARLTTLVFDVDGTLYAQGGLRRTMLLRLLGHALSSPVRGLGTLRALRAYRHAQELLRGVASEEPLADAQLRLAAERSGQSRESVVASVERWMEREPLDLLERLVRPGLHALLATAKQRGLRIGVLSDYPALAKLEAMKLAHHFEVLVSAQDARVNRFKPDPAGVLEVLRRLDAAPAQALYVGDREEVDGAAARAAGVACFIVGRDRGYRELGELLFPAE